MKKILLSAATGLVVLANWAGVSTESQYLYWGAESKTVGEFAYVQLKYSLNGVDYTSFDDGLNAASAYDPDAGITGGRSTEPTWTTLLSGQDWASAFFMADAYGNGGNYLGSSDVLAYTAIEGNLYDVFLPPTDGSAFNPVPAQFLLNIPGPIPEPTSGLLLLLGVAGLALRRKTR